MSSGKGNEGHLIQRVNRYVSALGKCPVVKHFTKKGQQYFWEIRIFIIRLLKYRAISLNDRLVLLGSFCQKLQEHIDNKTMDSIPSLFDYYINWLEDDASLVSLGNIPANYGIQMQLIKEILDERLVIGVNN